jgi:hypothetical protein
MYIYNEHFKYLSKKQEEWELTYTKAHVMKKVVMKLTHFETKIPSPKEYF